MTTTSITVPDVESILQVKNEAGDVLLEEEVIYIMESSVTTDVTMIGFLNMEQEQLITLED